jgi:hypothetical protein
MKKIIKPAAIIFFLITLSILAMFCIYLTGPIMLPSDLTRSAQSDEAFFAQITAEMNLIDVELTRMASEPELTSIPTPSVNSQNWLEHFLHSPTCQIPCWENIDPNKTDINTATKMISRIPGVRIISLNKKGIGWYFNDKSSRIGDIITNQEGIVVQTTLQIGFDENLSLSDVIKAYGHPIAIKAIWDCQYILSYRYQGMLLTTKNTSCVRESVDISPTTQIYQIILFSPDNQDYTLDIFTFNMNEIPWDGYKAYDFTNK